MTHDTRITFDPCVDRVNIDSDLGGAVIEHNPNNYWEVHIDLNDGDYIHEARTQQSEAVFFAVLTLSGM